MQTFREERLAKAPERFGEYLCTYLSDNEEVLIDLFKKPFGVKQQFGLIAYIRFQKELKYWDVQDNWPNQINEVAKSLGFKGIHIYHFKEPYDV